MTLDLETLLLSDGLVDLTRRRVLTRARELRLTTNEVALLRHLAAAAGRAVSREELLREVWGYSSGAVSRTVDVTVRRLRTKIEPDPAAPVHLLSVHGVGYTFVPAPGSAPSAPEEDEEEPAPPPPVVTPVVTPPITPAPAPVRAADPDGLIGRDTALADATERLAQGARPLTVMGPAGVGKTRLARALVERERAAGRVAWFIDLTSAATAEDLCVATATALALEASDDRTVARGLARAPGGLLVLDNFEQLPTEATRRLGAWIDAAPAVSFLVTTRRRLGLLSEDVLALDPLAPADAAALFRRRARRVRSDVRLTDDAALLRLVERLDGLPLAIELAASRVRALSVEELAERVELPLLRGAASGNRATLREALDASWALLSPQARRALAALSALPGGVFVAVAERLLERVDIEDPLATIEELVDHSLLRVVDGPPGTEAARTVPFVCVTEYGATQREATGTGAAESTWVGALADTLAEWAATLSGPDGRRGMARVLAEADAVLAATRRAEKSAPADVVRAVEAFAAASNLQAGHPAELTLLERAIGLVGDDDLVRARLLAVRIFAYDRAGRPVDACADADTLAALAKGRPELRQEYLRAEMGRVSVLRRADRPRDALAALAAIELPADLPAGFASYVANERGLLLMRLGDPAAAAVAFREGHRIAVAGGDLRRADMSFDHLVLANVEAGTAASMEQEARAARDRRRAAGGDAQASPLNYLLGCIALEAGRLEDARRYYRLEQAGAEARGRVAAAATTHFNLALVSFRAGNLDEAVEELETAITRFAGFRPDGIPTLLPVSLALARVARGDAEVPLTLPRVQDTPADRALAALGAAVVGLRRGEDLDPLRALARSAIPAAAVSFDLRAVLGFARARFPELFAG